MYFEKMYVVIYGLLIEPSQELRRKNIVTVLLGLAGLIIVGFVYTFVLFRLNGDLGEKTLFGYSFWLIALVAGWTVLGIFFPIMLFDRVHIPYTWFEKKWPNYAHAVLSRVSESYPKKTVDWHSFAAWQMAKAYRRFGRKALNAANYLRVWEVTAETVHQAESARYVQGQAEQVYEQANNRYQEEEVSKQWPPYQRLPLYVQLFPVALFVSAFASLVVVVYMILPQLIPYVVLILIAVGLIAGVRIFGKKHRARAWQINVATIFVVGIMVFGTAAGLIYIQKFEPNLGSMLPGLSKMVAANATSAPKSPIKTAVLTLTPTPTPTVKPNTVTPSPTKELLKEAPLPAIVPYSLETKMKVLSSLWDEISVLTGAVANTLTISNNAAQNLKTKGDMIVWVNLYFGGTPEEGNIKTSVAAVKAYLLTGFNKPDNTRVHPFSDRLTVLVSDTKKPLEKEEAVKLQNAADLLLVAYGTYDLLVQDLVKIHQMALLAGLDYKLLDLKKVGELFANAKLLEKALNEKIDLYNKHIETTGHKEVPKLPKLAAPDKTKGYVQFLEDAFSPETKNVYITATPGEILADIARTLLPATRTPTVTPTATSTLTPTATSVSVKLQTPQPAKGCVPQGTTGKNYLGEFPNLFDRNVKSDRLIDLFPNQLLAFIGLNTLAECRGYYPIVWEKNQNLVVGAWALVKDIPAAAKPGNIYIKRVPRLEDPFYGYKLVKSDKYGIAGTVVWQYTLPPTPTANPTAPVCITPPTGFTVQQKDPSSNWQEMVFYGNNGKAQISLCGTQYLYKIFPNRDDESFARWWFLSPYKPENIPADKWFWVKDPSEDFAGCTTWLDASCVVAYPLE